MLAGSMDESTFVSMKAAVEFVDILDHYSAHEDLICKYQFNDYTPQEGDRIAIFKLGWTLVKEYVLFEWAPTDSNAKIHHVVFNKHVLPKNTTELYQICYISGENELHGASSPFQFTMEPSRKTPNPFEIMMKSSMMESKSSKCSEKDESKREKELQDLRDENSVLRAAMKALTSQTGVPDGKNYDKDIAELREITDNLSGAMTRQQQEMNVLKKKIKECGEEYKKLYLEKLKLEKKLHKEKSDKSKESIKQVVWSLPAGKDFDISDLPSIPPFPVSK